jgi:cell division protein FtsB
VTSKRGGTRRSALGARQLVTFAVLAGIAYFAVEGGEYGTVAIVRQRLDKKSAARAIDSLKHAVDSLSKWKQAIATDPAVQERLAREEFGMIKAHEVLYRFAEPPADSGKPARKP